MKEMKIYKLIISIFLFVGLSSCNDWLNIEPKDTTTETDLFATGDGYRVALNGVYAQMAESSLYGQQLNWGFLDVIAHMYMLSELSMHFLQNIVIQMRRLKVSLRVFGPKHIII